MSSPAPPEPDEVDRTVAGDADAVSVPGTIPAPRSEPPRSNPDDAVTQIMPIIAAWPASGEEPPPPPSRHRPDEPTSATVAGRASVAGASRSGPDESTVDGPGSDLEIIDAVVLADKVEAFRRLGPVALEEDSWDGALVAIAADERRRRGDAVSTRLWVIVGLVLCALGAAIAIPFVLTAQREPTAAPPAAGLPTELDEPSQISADSSTGTGEPTPLATAAAATLLTSPSTSTAPAPTTTTLGSQQTSSSPPPPTDPPPPFSPVSFEAENGARGGSANVWDGYPDASGHLIVRNLGNWGGTPGTLQINGVDIPTTAAYTITIHFVHPDGEQNRSATMTVSGSNDMQVSFSGNANCCQTKVLNNITIAAGTHSISFANPGGHAPSIDRVVISRP